MKLPSFSHLIAAIFCRHQFRHSRQKEDTMDTLPPFLRNVINLTDETLRNDLIKEKYQWLINETGKLPSWTKLELDYFQNTCYLRNRYVNKLPYERCRVKLNKDFNPDKCDYINASHLAINDDSAIRYIASQAPKERTFGDFWQMTWEQDVAAIVMLAIADGRKADLYWSDERKAKFPCGIAVELSDIEMVTNYLFVRTFKLTFNSHSKSVKHYYFMAWPDHQVPKSDHLIKLFQTYWRDSFPSNRPILVHCSAGVGRTGTFCVIDQIIHLLKTKHNDSDHDIILDTILRYRDQRVSIVETYGKESINVGMSGILVTCFKNHEAKCTKEIYFLLSKAMESLEIEAEEKVEEEEGKNEESFESQISKEVTDLKDVSDKPFVAIEPCGLQCVVFLKAKKGIDPVKITEQIFEMIETSSIKSVKFCQRILPIQKICSANMEEVRKLATASIAPVFHNTTESFEYCVVFDSRLNGSLDRMTVINMLADIVGSKHKVNLSNPTKVILVQLMKSFCGISIVSNWVKYRKFNAQELLKQVMSNPE